MKYNFGKIKAACQSGTITVLVCLSIPSASFASDIELYKAPEISETTLMFMLDVSGSMNTYARPNNSPGYGCDMPDSVTEASRENADESFIPGVAAYRRQWCNGNDGVKYYDRITRLKDGMLKLLQGDADTNRLPDTLAVGLSDFSGTTGRIRQEVRPLSEIVTLSGSREIYRQTEQLNQPVSCTTSATQDTRTPQERTQTRSKTEKRTRTQTQQETRTQTQDRTRTNQRTRVRNRTTTSSPWGAFSAWTAWTNPSWSGWSSWSSWSAWADSTSWGAFSGWSGLSTVSAFPNWPSNWNSTPITNAGPSVDDAWTGGGACSNFGTAGSASITSAVMQVCTAWASNRTTCTNWQDSDKTLSQISYAGSNANTVAGAVSGQTTSQGAVTTTAQSIASWTPATPTATSNAVVQTPNTFALSGNAATDTGTNNTVNNGVVSSNPVAIGSATDSNPVPTSVLSNANRRETQTQSVVETQRQTQTGTRTVTNTETELTITTESRTQTSNTLTSRKTRTDTTTGTRADTRTTIYSGTAYGTQRQKMIDAVISLSAGDSTPTAFAYAEVAAYMMGQTTKDLTGSGFGVSSGNAAIQDGNNYIAPARVTSTKQCNTQGIYFLTDGQPNYSNNSYGSFMTSTLGDKGSSFGCTTNQLVSTGNSWGCIGNYAKSLLSPALNPAGVSIKTAVVGFGSSFGDGVTGSSDVENAKKWGEVGGGGWYSGGSPQSVVSSVEAFLKKLEKYLPPVTTGAVTIPVDALDTQNVQPWAYYQQFDPRPGEASAATWFGNVKKYKTLNNSLVQRGDLAIMTNGLLNDDINDYWADTSIKKSITKLINEIPVTSEVKVGGALSQMLLGYNDSSTPKERRIFTDRNVIADADDSTQNVINTITTGALNPIGKADFLASSSSLKKFREDPKRGYLLSLFGYTIGKDLINNLVADPKNSTYQTQLETALAAAPGRDWLMGAVMHSRPIMLTQKGTTTYTADPNDPDAAGTLSYADRDDLILFGSTQGVLHVVRAGKTADDTDAGKELFAFVPSEMVENQPQAFLPATSQNDSLRYGIDGQWTAYTEYVTKKTSDPNLPIVTVKGGKQWVYGGLRMGGKSYYALDLSDISSSDTSAVPKIKFKIDPVNSSSGSGESHMGQSWSKPTIAWVNWKGSRKLVMFVGGGYDPGYENDTYQQINGVGAGVYMFDANDGTLLWWASSNATTANTSSAPNALNVSDMEYSVVSQIKAIDRNADGMVDHLYFGDLGGQMWRVDINNALKADSSDAFAKRAVKILDLSSSDGTAPRFYTTPTFTIHNGGGSSGMFGVISIGSGNLSLPMSAVNHNKDAVYVIYDKDVAKPNLYQLASSDLTTVGITKGSTGETLADNSNGATKTDLTRAGWYYPFASGTKYRVLNDPIAIDSDLYVSVFDASVDPTSEGCLGGVRGESKVHKFCLPYGQCTEMVNNTPTVQAHGTPVFLGKGNIGLTFGGVDGKTTDRTLILNVPKTTGTTIPNYAGKLALVSQRWYEKYAK